jgi:hypothetical protein
MQTIIIKQLKPWVKYTAGSTVVGLLYISAKTFVFKPKTHVVAFDMVKVEKLANPKN